MNMTVKSRLVAVIGFLTVVAIAIGMLGLHGMGRANDGLKTVYENRTMALEYVSRVDRLLTSSRLAITFAVFQRTGVPGRVALAEKNQAEIDKVWADYTAGGLTSEERKLAEKFTRERDAVTKDGMAPTLAALRAEQFEEAQKLLLEQLEPLMRPTRETMEALRKLQVDVANQEYLAAQERYTSTRNRMIAIVAIALLVAATVGWLLIRSVYSQLGGEPGYAAQVVGRIAAGDLTVHIATRGNDRGSLLFSMKTMQENLAKIIAEIKQSTDTIATASGEIAAGSLDLSSRTEQQAASLEETASSMEELTSTVRQNADNARQANQLAASASGVATKGGTVVSQVVGTMGSINDSARKIVDIIGVIDGIAFQTNILALNAAVEAARAGEQGRGFAVVAAEVRNLAQRSAGAAKEIKELISDSVEKVDAGAKLVDQAGITMDEIVASVKRVTDIMSEITAASQEQTAGIEQVNQAISQMDDATQQNASLVEQAAAAAQSMQEQSKNLARAVGTFKLDARRAPAPAASLAASRSLALKD